MISGPHVLLVPEGLTLTRRTHRLTLRYTGVGPRTPPQELRVLPVPQVGGTLVA